MLNVKSVIFDFWFYSLYVLRNVICIMFMFVKLVIFYKVLNN